VTERTWVHLLLLFALASLLFFLGLGTLGLTDRDEGSNAEAAREMVETGDWVTPTLNYEPRFAKPVFIYWLMSAAYRLFGVSEFTARLPSAFFGVALILLQYAFLARVRGPLLGLMGGLMLLLNVEMLAIGRLALTDSVLIFFTTLSLFGFWLGLHGSTGLTTGGSTKLSAGHHRHFFWLFYLGMALGALTKGPIGVAVPLLAVVPYLTLTRRWSQFWRFGFPLAGLALFALVAIPWYATMLAIHGSRYTASAQADTLGRFLHVIGGHGFTVLFYVPILLFGFFPWSAFLPAALYQTWTQWRTVCAAASPEPAASPPPAAVPLPVSPVERKGELEMFAALWLVAGFVFFSLSATRLPHYIGPLYPAAAILTASYWTRCLADPGTRGIRGSIHLMTVLGYLLGLALIAMPTLYDAFVGTISKEFPMATQVDPGNGPIAAGVIVLVGMALVRYFGLSEERRPAAFWAAGAVIALVALIAIQIVLPRFSRYFIAPPQQLAYTAGVNLGPDDRLILYGPPKPSFIFYARRKAVVIRPGQEQDMIPHLAKQGRTMILLPSRLKPKLPAEAAGFPVILERFGYSLLANEPMVQGLPAEPARAPGFNPHGMTGR
jgi:4-amino-4-deoxy-L-arabinose transferase-like glycosyltransferase